MTTPSPAADGSTPQFTSSDCAVLDEFATRVPWNEVSEPAKAVRRSIRERLKEIARYAASTYEGRAPVKAFASVLTPNGRAPRDYWCCIYPESVPNKSFGFQVAFILSAEGGELCFCLGAGTSQEQDVETQLANQAALRKARARLLDLTGDQVASLETSLENAWHFRRHWRDKPGSDFDSLFAWLSHASSPGGEEASVSRYYTREQLDELGSAIVWHFEGACRLFAPLLDFVYAPVSETKPVSSPQPIARGPKTWCIATGEGGLLWPEFSERSLIAIGARGLRTDLRSFSSKEAIAEALKPLSDDGAYPTNEALCCFEFSREMREGDFVLAKRGMSDIVGYGTVTGQYEFDATRHVYPHIRTVRWTNQGSWRLPDSLRVPVKTLTDVTGFTPLLEYVMPLVTNTSQPPVHSRPLYTIDEALEGIFIERDRFLEMRDRLARKKNLILEGPPGVGKTFIAKRLGFLLMGRKDPSKLEMIQFHQSYAYEDFIRGWRPTHTGGFVLQDGVFYRFCKAAEADLDNSFVFIIDEINRGNLSKIFGEVMMLIEADKRSMEYAVPLTYQREATEKFWIPPNVHVIGMMNTADRSLAMVDYALRRRFSFARLRPEFDSSPFRNYLLQRGAETGLVERIIDRLTALNERITGDEKNFGPGFEIGHSYFCMQGSESAIDEAWFKSIVFSEIEPLLHEYWPDNPKRVRELVAALVA